MRQADVAAATATGCSVGEATAAPMSRLTHLDATGAANMVDVSEKAVTDAHRRWPKAAW